MQGKHFTDKVVSPAPVNKVFYWNSALLICLDVSSGCFHIPAAEPNPFSKYCLFSKAKIFSFWSLTETSYQPLLQMTVESRRTGHVYLCYDCIWLAGFHDLRAITDSLVCHLLLHKNLPSRELLDSGATTQYIPSLRGLCIMGLQNVPHHSPIHVLNHLAKIY